MFPEENVKRGKVFIHPYTYIKCISLYIHLKREQTKPRAQVPLLLEHLLFIPVFTFCTLLYSFPLFALLLLLPMLSSLSLPTLCHHSSSYAIPPHQPLSLSLLPTHIQVKTEVGVGKRGTQQI